VFSNCRPVHELRERSSVSAAPKKILPRHCHIEALETRTMLAVFLNDIDSNNLGKGMWGWTLSTSMSNDGFSSQTSWFSYLRNTQHLDYLITKAGNGDSLNSQYTKTM